MKKLLLLFLLLPIMVSAQSKWTGFFRPLERSAFEVIATIDGERKVSETTSLWLFRPVISVSAMSFILEKPVKVTTLNSLGTGIAYSHFTNANGEPYNNFGVNFLVLFGTQIADVTPLELSIASTVTAFQYVNIGAGYNFGTNKTFLLTGITISFN